MQGKCGKTTKDSRTVYVGLDVESKKGNGSIPFFDSQMILFILIF